MKRSMLAILIVGVIFISACTSKTVTKENMTNFSRPSNSSQVVDYSCTVDSDCEIKDIHNCCGYYPQCVNKNFEPDVDAVKKICAEKGVRSVCGFPSLNRCDCVSNICEGTFDPQKAWQERKARQER